MPILNIVTSQVGQVGLVPHVVYIATNDTIAQVTTAGYLNKAVQNGATFSESDMALVSTKTSPSATSTQVAWLEISKSGSNWSLVATGSPGSVVLPTVANQIVHATNATGTLSTDAANIVNLGNITAGSSAVAGSITSFAGTGTTEFLRLAAINNTGGNFSTTISNTASVGQSQTISIPDAGAATANFLISSSGAGQAMTGGLTLTTGNFLVSAGTITSSGAITANAGAVTSGLSAGGFVGLLKAFSTTATSGFIALQAANNATGNFGLTISNATAQAQATVLTVTDVGAATGFINPQTVSASTTPASVLITKDVTLGFAALAAGGTVAVQAALAGSQYKVRDIFVNYGAAGLSGGGGDRLVTLTDGTTVYNDAGITAALLGTPVNTVWGGTGNPLAGTVAQNTSTVAGQALRFIYSGGAADYTAGSVVVTVTYERVL